MLKKQFKELTIKNKNKNKNKKKNNKKNNKNLKNTNINSINKKIKPNQ